MRVPFGVVALGALAIFAGVLYLMEGIVFLEYIVFGPVPTGDGRVLDYWKRWSSIPAVRNRRVFAINATTSLRAGPRVADAVESLAGLLHPRREPKAAGSGPS